MTRTEGWEIRLGKFLMARAKLSFAWGMNDCAIFPADAVLEMTGEDPAAQWRGYTTEVEAAAIMKDAGGLAALITIGLGCQPHSNYRMARRGDVALINREEGPTGFIVDDSGTRLAGVTIDQGVVRLPLKLAHLIWSF